MKYMFLQEADCCVLDTVKADMVDFERQLQFHATKNVMPGFIVFRTSTNTSPGLTPTRLGSTYMGDGTLYIDLQSPKGQDFLSFP